MGICSPGYPAWGQPGTVAISSRGNTSIFIKAAACLVLLALLCYGIFSKNETFLIVPSGKRKADAKVTTLRRIFQIFRKLFFKAFRPSGEPTGSSPKAGAKVVGSHVTAKHIQDFFYRIIKVFCSTAGIQRVTNAQSKMGDLSGTNKYTIIIYIRGRTTRKPFPKNPYSFSFASSWGSLNAVYNSITAATVSARIHSLPCVKNISPPVSTKQNAPNNCWRRNRLMLRLLP